MKTITVAAQVDQIEQVLDFINEILEAADCPMKTVMQIDIAVEEIFVNIAHYAYPNAEGSARVGCRIDETGCVLIRFWDSGIPYDPLAKEDPDVTLSAEERKIGGLGIYMVKKSMDSVEYAYIDGQNVLTLKKAL